MTQNEKDLLRKDLCARLPYGVKLDTLEGPQELDIRWLAINMCNISSPYLPYLFPLSSMTAEQREELYKIGWYLDGDKIYSCFRNYDDVNYKTHTDCFELINWCYKNKLDINGFIPMGLALDATGLNIY